jgi:hypothetical protein
MSEQYKLVESQVREVVLEEMKIWAAAGWRLHSFGFGGPKIGWYALMTFTKHPSPLETPV